MELGCELADSALRIGKNDSELTEHQNLLKSLLQGLISRNQTNASPPFLDFPYMGLIEGYEGFADPLVTEG